MQVSGQVMALLPCSPRSISHGTQVMHVVAVLQDTAQVMWLVTLQVSCAQVTALMARKLRYAARACASHHICA